MPDALVERDDYVMTITMNRPKRLNALSGATLVRMYDAFVEASADDDVRAIILTGAEGNFTSGADLKAMAGDSGPDADTEIDVQARMTEDPDLMWKALLRSYRPTKPILAAVEGVAIAGGTEILQGTDIRVAGESAKFGVSEARWALYPMGGSAGRLARQIPYTAAADILPTRKHISPPAALQVALIGHPVPPGRGPARGQESAGGIARLPAKFQDTGPRVIRAPVKEISFIGGKFTAVPGDPGDPGDPVDWWFYEDLRRPLIRLDASVGHDRDDVTVEGTTYDWMRPGAHQVKPRLEDMDTNWIEASLCFPTFPRFCGQTFTEASDRELGLLCVKAYNDWMVEEWCAESGGRLIPLTIVPLWDAVLAGEEVRRNAERGVRAVCFSEIPPFLGLPSIHDPDNYWDPFFAACEDTGTVINMHIGSSSKMPSTSADAPAAVGSTLTFAKAWHSLGGWRVYA